MEEKSQLSINKRQLHCIIRHVWDSIRYIVAAMDLVRDWCCALWQLYCVRDDSSPTVSSLIKFHSYPKKKKEKKEKEAQPNRHNFFSFSFLRGGSEGFKFGYWWWWSAYNFLSVHCSANKATYDSNWWSTKLIYQNKRNIINKHKCALLHIPSSYEYTNRNCKQKIYDTLEYEVET